MCICVHVCMRVCVLVCVCVCVCVHACVWGDGCACVSVAPFIYIRAKVTHGINIILKENHLLVES